MSAQPDETTKDQDRSALIDCSHPDCDEYGYPWEFQGDYCSNRCEVRHEGRKALSHLKYSHTRCYTCTATLKTIEPPKPDSAFDVTGAELTYDADEGQITMQRYSQEVTRRAAVGFQHLTPDAGIGEKDIGEKIATGTVCDHCGSTDHTTHTPFLVKTDSLVSEISDYLSDEDYSFSEETLHQAYSETDDLELAAGRAIHD